MRKFFKTLSVILMLTLSGGCTSDVSVTLSTSTVPVTVSETTTLPISTTEKVTTPIETTSLATSAQKVEFIGYDGKELPSSWIEISDDGAVTFRCCFGYYNDKIIRLDYSDSVNHLFSDVEYYSLY